MHGRVYHAAVQQMSSPNYWLVKIPELHVHARICGGEDEIRSAARNLVILYAIHDLEPWKSGIVLIGAKQ